VEGHAGYIGVVSFHSGTGIVWNDLCGIAFADIASQDGGQSSTAPELSN
jgi:hypothetical protein